jgi:hypothetical protein
MLSIIIRHASDGKKNHSLHKLISSQTMMKREREIESEKRNGNKAIK